MNEILIASPVSNRAWCLPYYLKCLNSIEYPKDKMSLYFIVNNSMDDSLKILNEFKNEYSSHYKSIKIDVSNSKVQFQDERSTNVRHEYTYNNLVRLRNLILEYAKKIRTDYLFSIDSDILIKSNTLNKLLKANVPIISSLIYNGYIHNPEEPWRYTNIMKQITDGSIEHITNWYTKNAETLTESKVIPVDVTGAAYLIHKDVINSGVRYEYHIQGEDIPFSLNAKSKGFQSYCDLSAFSYHCMNEELLKHFIEKI